MEHVHNADEGGRKLEEIMTKYEAEKALVDATLRGPLMALADKLKGDQGYWAEPVFNVFNESWACTKCEDDEKGTLRACGKPKKTKSSGILLPRARCEKCTRSTEGMPLVKVMVDQMIFEANENTQKASLALETEPQQSRHMKRPMRV